MQNVPVVRQGETFSNLSVAQTDLQTTTATTLHIQPLSYSLSVCLGAP
jgi:hypothetical protein